MPHAWSTSSSEPGEGEGVLASCCFEGLPATLDGVSVLAERLCQRVEGLDELVVPLLLEAVGSRAGPLRVLEGRVDPPHQLVDGPALLAEPLLELLHLHDVGALHAHGAPSGRARRRPERR